VGLNPYHIKSQFPAIGIAVSDRWKQILLFTCQVLRSVFECSSILFVGAQGVQRIRSGDDTPEVQSSLLQCKRLTHPETRAVEAARQEGDTASRDTVSQMLITHSVLFVYV